VTEEEVYKVVSTLNAHKASDIYKIKPRLLKDLALTLSPLLTNLFNEAIDNHDYPDSLKFTKVIEIYKKKDRTHPANYRPISLLPIVAKVLDVLINKQLMDHLTKYDLISPTQYAFRPNSNTTLALQAVLNEIHKHKKARKPTVAAYVDLSKAYDTVSHSKLIHKLRHLFNFSEAAIAFFSSYFRNRRQTTHTQHAKSKVQTITHGIPQGSTLSTTLFLLYINDIIKTVPKSTVYTYADDTTLIVTAPTVKELQTLAQSELSNLISYFHANNLVPNATKTQYTVFYPRSAVSQVSLQMGSTALDHTAVAPLLGIKVQQDLKHKGTVNKLIQKLYPTVKALKYAARLLPESMMVDMYFSHVYPHLIYAIPVWGTDNGTKAYIKPLVRVHKRIIRIIAGVNPRAHTKPLMSKYKILNIPNLYKFRACAEAHAFIHPKLNLNRPQHDHKYAAAANVHTHATRHATKSARYTSHDQEHFTRKYTKLWNSLPESIRATEGYKHFKVLLKELLLAQQAV
jgi:hypothetical protein